MADFLVQTVNSSFVADTELGDVETAEQALTIGVRGAVAIASDDIFKGGTVASVIVTVSANGQRLAAAAVSLSVAPLIVSDKVA